MDFNNAPVTLFEVSWEVCNKVGGIYSVVSSKALQAVETFGEDYFLLGPSLQQNAGFEETDEHIWDSLRLALSTRDLKCRLGRWNIPGRPKAILVDFSQRYSSNQLLYEMWKNYGVDSLSGGQQQRVAIARAIVNEPEVLLLDEPLAALDLKMRKDMQMELKEMHKSLGITFIYVTHDQEEALTLSDTIVVMSEGKIQQIGTPIDIYNEPINSFVADFIGESNILNGLMIKDKLVSFAGHEFECVDEGFGERTPVDVVLRPEDIYIFEPSEAAMLTGTVTSSIFKGVHYEMMVQTPEGYEFMVQDYHCFDAGQEVGLLVKPFDIHVMKKERICNTFEGKMVDATHVEFLGCTFECREVSGIDSEAPVQVEVDFDRVILEDNEEDGRLTGEVKFILYKGNHYHLTVFTDWDEDIFVDTNDVWDDGDRVGITIAPENIRIVQSTKKEGSDK